MRRKRGRPRFAELVDRQLDLFAEDHAGLVRDAEAALAAYTSSPKDEAEERYGDFVDLVDTGRDALEEIRDTYARTLEDDAAEEYRALFNDHARRRFPRFGFELD
jgi:hypothetical protein